MTIEEARKILVENRPNRPNKTKHRQLQQAIDVIVMESFQIEAWRRFDTRDAGQAIDGKDVVFSDGILTIITSTNRVKRKILCGQYDLPISLDDIRKQKGVIVIIEDHLDGFIYRYGNHGQFWEKIGCTIGFA